MSIDSSTGVFSWTPSEAQGPGTYTATSVVVTDTGGLTDSASLIITVNKINDAPQFTSSPITSVAVSVAYSYAITAIDEGEIVGSGELTITLVTGPDWLSLTDNSDGTKVVRLS